MFASYPPPLGLPDEPPQCFRLKAVVNGGVPAVPRSSSCQSRCPRPTSFSETCKNTLAAPQDLLTAYAVFLNLEGSSRDHDRYLNDDESDTPAILGMATIAAMSFSELALSFNGIPVGINVACFPFFFIPTTFSTERGNSAGAVTVDETPTSRARYYQSALVTSSAAQAITGTLQMLFDDPLNGFINFVVATFGFQASTTAGHRMLPSYIVLTFCNGTMQSLLGLEAAAASHVMSSVASKGVIAKIATVLSVASPALMFMGLAAAWQLHVEIRSAMPHSPVPDGTAGNRSQGVTSAVPESGVADSTGFRPFTGEPRRLHVASET